MRGDGRSVDATFCASGKYRSQTDTAVSTGKRWFIRNARFTKLGFTAIVAENKDRAKGGFSIAIEKRGKRRLLGIASFDQPTSMGPVTRKAAGAECASR